MSEYLRDVGGGRRHNLLERVTISPSSPLNTVIDLASMALGETAPSDIEPPPRSAFISLDELFLTPPG